MRFAAISICVVFSIGCGNKNPTPIPAQSPVASPTPPTKNLLDTALAGSWVLAGLPQSSTSFDKLYPRQRPVIFIQPELQLISGSTGCNRFSAQINTMGNQLSFVDFTSSTLTCVGAAETIFLEAWKQSKTYRFKNSDEMVWGTDSIPWMVFHRR